MPTEKWNRIESIFGEALKLPAGERRVFLDKVCGNDAALRAEVNALLQSHEDADAFLPTLLKSGGGSRKLGNYEVMELVGRGGMGAVYRARDLKLKRDVAIKVLPGRFSSDPDRVLRFQREAELLAALNHPHIAAIYDLQEIQDSRFLVLEFVEGETLGDRIGRGPIPADEALQIVLQIAQALEAAHDKGIIHRDLKPSNIKLTRDGKVKILDFGLAKVRERAGDDLSGLPTQMTASAPGTILGTPAYMAPEQAKGTEAGRAADVWAFGCVLFEMLAGKRAFRGETVPDILAEVLKAEPQWEDLPVETPPAIHRLLRRCLQKDVRSRFHDIGDVRIAIEDRFDSAPAAPAAKRSRWLAHGIWAAVLSGVIAAALFIGRPGAEVPEIHLEIATPPEGAAGGIALSADGTKMAYTGLVNFVPRLFVRSLENGSVQALAGTDGVSFPFWSPNGESLGFFAESKLKRIDLETGTVRELADVTLSPSGGTWNRDGTILFAPNISGGIFRVADTGQDTPRRIVPDGRMPKFLDDGRHFFFQSLYSEIHAASLDDLDRAPFVIEGYMAMPAAPGYAVYVSGSGLFIQRFDADTLTLTGTARQLAEGVSFSSDGASASVAASATGIIAFREISAIAGQPRRLSWFDRSGKETERMSDLGGVSPALSPDGAYVTMSRTTDTNAVWLLETSRKVLERFTPGVSNQTSIFSPDGRHVVFSSARHGFVELFIKPVDGGMEKPIFDPPDSKNARVVTDWSGEYLLYRENSEATRFDIGFVNMSASERKAVSVLATEAAERDAQFSPDMKWIAYESNKSERSEIYMTRFPVAGREFPISTNGGAQVRWNPRNPNELFYVALDGRLMSVGLTFSPDGKAVKALDPVALFQTRMGAVVQGPQKQQYVVSKDGERFLVSNMIEEALSPITVIVNWKPRR